MDLVISEETLRSAHPTAEELKQEIAVMLFRQDRLTLIQAAELAEILIRAQAGKPLSR